MAHLQNENVQFEIEEELKEAFGMFDNDADGKITVAELGKAMEKLGQKLSEKELQKMISKVDKNGSGAINYKDFKTMMQAQLEQKSTDDEIRQAFELFDKNKDGKITPQELKEVMSSLGEQLTDQDVEDMIYEADQTGDGTINFNEFKRMMLIDDIL
eukprot:230564_1